MTGSVIRRLGTTVDDAGLIHHDDQPATWADADALAGRRVDRRRCYAIMQGEDGQQELCDLARWTGPCSGCTTGYEGPGGGCAECGFRGVVRNAAWVPWLPPEDLRD